MTPHRAIPSLLHSPSLLIPPVADNSTPGPDRYVYFEQSGDSKVLFQPQANELSWPNAWWLAECALLAYQPPGIATPLFSRAGFTHAQPLADPGQQLQCYVLERPEAIVIAFRGTVIPGKTLSSVPEALKNWATNFGIGQDDMPHRPTEKVHRGFLKGAIALLAQIQPHLTQLLGKPTKPVWLTGHSLGGALATVTGALLTQAQPMGKALQPQGIYVFGCPRIGNTSFAKNYPAPLWRFANQTDLVPRVPLHTAGSLLAALPWVDDYAHAGQSVYVDTTLNAQIGTEPPGLDFPDLSGGPMLHHAPIAYAMVAWNHA
jgi:triacylglycerol lipase